MRESFIEEAKSAFETRHFPAILERYEEVEPYIGQDEDVQKVKDKAEKLREKYQAEWKAYEETEFDSSESAVQVLKKLKQKYPWDDTIADQLQKKVNDNAEELRYRKECLRQKLELLPWVFAGIATFVGFVGILRGSFPSYIPYSPSQWDLASIAGIASLLGGIIWTFYWTFYRIIDVWENEKESVLGGICLVIIGGLICLCLGIFGGSLLGALGAVAGLLVIAVLPVAIGIALGAAGGALLGIAVKEYLQGTEQEVVVGAWLGGIVGGVLAIIAWATGNIILANVLFIPVFAWVGYGLGEVIFYVTEGMNKI